MRKYLKGLALSSLGGFAGAGTSVAFGGEPSIRAFLVGMAVVFVLDRVRLKA